ncbi:SWIM zinc finger family protein [Nonomuraea jabiensis]|uniref:SWIM zinc finger family protein n=1 Tax=Nonomuraea jabiensis TaxID=882448 RepID=UPI003D705C47
MNPSTSTTPEAAPETVPAGSPGGPLPPVTPEVVAAAVESLTSRLRKKLDAAIEQYAALPVTAGGEGVRITCGEDAVVTLSPGASGVIADGDQASCSCLLAPRCLHRAAVLSACPIGDAVPGGAEAASHDSSDAEPAPPAGGAALAGSGGARTAAGPGNSGPGAEPGDGAEAGVGAGAAGGGPVGAEAAGAGAAGGGSAGAGAAGAEAAGAGAAGGGSAGGGSAGAGSVGAGPVGAPEATGPTAAQVEAAAGLWAAAAAVLSAGVPAAGAVPQAELLRAAHTARLAGLAGAEAAALRVVRGLRAARARHDGHRLADLVSALRELLLTAGRLAGADPDPALVGTVRRNYQPGGSLKVYGVFREPVISATGYGGVVTHVVAEDGRWFSVADVKPGGSARARGAATAPVAIGPAMLNHSQLSRAGLLIVGATVSPDGRLGAGKGVRATPVSGMPWTEGPMAALFARPLAEAAGARLSGHAWSESDTAEQAREPVGCDLVIVGAAGDHVLARALLPGESDPVGGFGPLIRLVPASHHPELAHVDNLRRLASRPGLLVRVVGRVEPDRVATLLPLAVGPVPGTEATLRLPPEWQGHADLGYDRLQGAHLPPQDACPPPPDGDEVDPVAGAPLWRVRRLVELAVSGGRRAVAESARNGESYAQLRAAGFQAAADLVTGLTAEADRRSRDVFGRLTDTGPDRYAWAWVAAATHLAATERAMIHASWQPDDPL